jgi:basic membrane protein A
VKTQKTFHKVQFGGEKMKKLYSLMAVLLIATMLLTACQTTGGAKFTACQVTDTGGIDDKSFNATAWKGVEDAKKSLGTDGKYLESQQQTDYEKNINEFINAKCGIIITVGFLLGDATKAAAANRCKFSIVDLPMIL